MTGTKLKTIAMLAMLLDHMWLFIPDMPYFFHWIGRLSAPVFIYFCVVGTVRTSNVKSYLWRLYILSLMMGLINYCLGINLNFIRTLLMIAIIIVLIEKDRNKEKHCKSLIGGFVLWQLITSAAVLLMIRHINMADSELLVFITATNNLMALDGGIWFVLIGLVMYFYRHSIKLLAIGFLSITVLHTVFSASALWPLFLNMLYELGLCDLELFLRNFFSTIFGIHPQSISGDIFFQNPQWMMLFSIPLIASYNGQKGIGLKWAFYVFYPAHIVLLYFLA